MIRTEPNSSDELRVPVLAVQETEKSYPGVRALEHVSFDCRAGEIHGLVGENGAGKSTLMRILAGVIQPDAGTILVKGRPVVLASPRHAHDLGIAIVVGKIKRAAQLGTWRRLYPAGDEVGFSRRAPTARAASWRART